MHQLEARTLPSVNLITNGDFEAGATGFTSAYQQYPGSGLLNEGFYAVTTSPRLVHADAASYGDHTSGSGRMMVANGALTANLVLWSQTVTVTPNTPHNFSLWGSSWYFASPARLDVLLGGVSIGIFTAPGQSALWNQFTAPWVSGTSSTATITIINRNIDFSGNDFAIDDLSLTEIGSGAISGSKFNNLDGNGMRDAGEPTLAGWTVYLDLNNNGTREGNEPGRATDGSGNYLFTGLTPGEYVIREVVQSGWVQTAPAAGAHSVTLSDETPIATGRDFGNFRFGSVAGVKFQDLNSNGMRDAGEPGLAGWTIYNDVNDNGQLDQTVVALETDDHPAGTIPRS